MKKRIAIFVVLMMVFCLALTGCAQKTENQGNGQGNNPATIVTEAPAEDFSKTPESLENTAWVLKDEPDASARVALFFRNGKVTIITQSYHYEDSYSYKNSILETDPINIGFEGEVDGARLVVTYYGNPHPDLTRVSIADAILYAKEINPGCATPFDSNYPGIDFDTGDSGIMDGSNNGDGGNNGSQNADGSYTWQVGKYTLTTHINIMDYIDGDVWRANEMAIALGWDPIAVKKDGSLAYSATVKTPNHYEHDGLRIRYDLGETCTTFKVVRGDTSEQIFAIIALNTDSFVYRMNDYTTKWSFEEIVCFAYACEQLSVNGATNPFEGMFTYHSSFNGYSYD